MKKQIKKLSAVLLLLAGMQAFAQVGVGNQNPQGIFHVDGAKDNPTSGVPTAAQATNDVIVTSTGAVGLGLISPLQKLHLSGTNGIGFGTFASDKKLYSPADGLLEWNTNNNAPERGFSISDEGGNKKVYLNINGSSYFTGGNVGIGTTNPVFKLQIEGNDSGSTTRVLIRNASATANSAADFLAQNNAGSNVQIGINSSTSTAANIYTGVSGTSSYVRTTSGPLYALAVNGGVFLAQGATAWSSTSDKRTKKNILKLENGLTKLASLSGYTYNYNFDNEKEPRRVGLMAQEVQQVLPEAVSVNNDGILSIRYTELTPLIIEAVKDLKNELDAKNKELMQEKTNNELFQEKTMKELTQQKTMIDNLINEIKTIKSQLNNR